MWVSLDFLPPYLLIPLLWTPLGSAYSIISFLTFFYKTKAENPYSRMQILTAIFFVKFFAWSFIAVTLIFIYLFSAIYEAYHFSWNVGLVFGYSLLAALYVTVPLSILVCRLVPLLLIRRIRQHYAVKEPRSELAEAFERLSRQMGIGQARLLVADIESPVSLSIGGNRKYVIISDELERLLDGEELNAVLAHELAHLRSPFINVKMLVRIYKKILSFDPLAHFVEAALNRESEYVADEDSARATGQPLALASALIKIYENRLERSAPLPLGFKAKAGFSLDGQPPLKERVERLIRLASAPALKKL